MIIVLDTRWIFPEISGIGAYTQSLASELTRMDRENQYVLLHENPVVMERTMKLIPPDGSRIQHRLLPFGLFSIKNQLAMKGVLQSLQADIYHSTNYLIPLAAFPSRRRGRTACVVTIHDMIPMVFPHHAPRSKKSRAFPVYKALMRSVGARADRIITDSDCSKRDVINHLRIPDSDAGKVRTIYCGVDSAYQPGTRKASDIKTILYVGRFDPYKNVSTLIRAYAQLCKESPVSSQLVIAGSRDDRYPETPRLASELGIEDRVKWTGYLSPDELVTTYQQSDLLVLPSRYEGFGLPVVEAMACGIPVICSTGGSLPEVAGDVGILVDPDDQDGFTQAMSRVLSDPARWQDLAERGPKHAATFSWQKAAAETLSLYQELAP